MDIGCHLPNQGPLANGESLVRFARAAEEREVASLWVSDHVIFPRSATGSYPGRALPASARQAVPRAGDGAGRRRGRARAGRGSAPRCSSWATGIRW